MNEIKIIKISDGEKADELRDKIINLINEYSGILNGYEMIGVIDTIREDCHGSIQAMDEDE